MVNLEDRGRNHEYYRDLLGAYALGAATEPERQAVATHVATCEVCRAEVSRLRAVALALPLALEPRHPSPALRDRIWAAALRDVANGQRPTTVPKPVSMLPRQTEPTATATLLPGPHVRRRFVTLWAAVALLLAFSLGMLIWNLQLHQALDEEEMVESVALRPTQAATGVTARLTHLEDRRVMIVSVRDLPPLSPGQVYQLWLLRGDTSVPAGIFVQPRAECAVAADPSEYQAVAITAEPGPWGSPDPTGAPVFHAPLEPMASSTARVTSADSTLGSYHPPAGEADAPAAPGAYATSRRLLVT